MRALCPDIDLLYVSGYTDDAIVQHGITARAINYIQKPFNTTAFLGKIREILEEHP
ncbi:MAG: hypothetical protein ABSG21_18090 [Spirochaetia bacterium]